MRSHLKTRHSTIRGQQRGIADDVVVLIYEQGDLIYCAAGNAELVGLSRDRMQELRSASIPVRTLERAKNVFLVLGANGQILTVQHQLRPYRNCI
jgi:hypothetical protein